MGRMGHGLKKVSKLVVSGIDTKRFNGSVTIPIYNNSTIIFSSYREFLNAKKDRFSKPYYGRFKTETVRSFETIIQEIYETEKAIITSSGLSAIIISITSLLKKNDHILLVENCYEPVSNFIKSELNKFGVEHDFYSSDFDYNIQKLKKKNTKLIYLESPGSLNFKVQDLDRFVAFAKKNNITTIMDNTWSTVLGCNPKKHGVDIVVESATKYFSGHSDCFCGLIACNKEYYEKIFKTKVRFGDFVSSENCYLAIRGLRTLSLRLKQHFHSAKLIIKFLKTKKIITSILFQGDPKSKDYNIWKKYHSLGNGLITIKITKIDNKTIADFIDNLKFFKIGFSWGGFESLILPLESINPNNKYNNDKDGFWIRIHVGLEDVKDLIDDLENAINHYENNL